MQADTAPLVSAQGLNGLPSTDAVFPDLTVERTGDLEVTVSWTVDASESYSRYVLVGACLESLMRCVLMPRRSLQVTQMLLQCYKERRGEDDVSC